MQPDSRIRRKLSSLHFSSTKKFGRPFSNFIAVLLLSAAFAAVAPAANGQTDSPDAPSSAIQGKVLTAGSARPVASVIVTFRSQDAGFSRSVLTDIEGQFEVQGTPPGKYSVTIEEPGYEPFQAFDQVGVAPLKLLIYLVPAKAAPAPPSANTVSVRELSIPHRAQDEFRKGLLELGKNALTDSLNHFMKATHAFAGYYEAFYHAGIVQLRLGHTSEALQSFQEAVTLSGGRFAQAQYGMGYALYLDDQPVEAEKVLRRGIDSDPKLAEGYEILGMVEVKLNRLDDAEKNAREALLRDANCAGAYLVLSDVSGQRKDYRQQLVDLDNYLKLQPAGPVSERVEKAREATITLLANADPQK
jgi:Tfp pilus assembly protein PilF